MANIVVCAGPPFCRLNGNAAVLQQMRGCIMCRRVPVSDLPGEVEPPLNAPDPAAVLTIGRTVMGDDFDEEEAWDAMALIDEAALFGGMQ